MKKYSFVLCFVAVLSCFSWVGCAGDNPTVPSSTISTDVVAVDSVAIKKEAEAKAKALALKEAKAKEIQDSIAQVEAEKEEKRLALAKAEKKRKAKAAKAKQGAIDVKSIPMTQPTVKPASKKKKGGAKIKFVEKKFDFGTIKEGAVVKHSFEYTNEGTEDLLIMDAKVTCGCTAPGFSFFPLEPGLSSAINVSFNSAHKLGPQRPTVTIYTNGTPSMVVLTLEGNVIKPAPTTTNE